MTKALLFYIILNVNIKCVDQERENAWAFRDASVGARRKAGFSYSPRSSLFEAWYVALCHGSREDRSSTVIGIEWRDFAQFEWYRGDTSSSQFVEAEAFIFCKYLFAYIGRKEYK